MTRITPGIGHGHAIPQGLERAERPSHPNSPPGRTEDVFEGAPRQPVNIPDLLKANPQVLIRTTADGKLAL